MGHGRDMHIVIVDDKAFIVLQPFSAWYLNHFRCFEVCSAEDSQLVVVEPAELNHYAPCQPTWCKVDS